MVVIDVGVLGELVCDAGLTGSATSDDEVIAGAVRGGLTGDDTEVAFEFEDKGVTTASEIK